MIPEWNMSGVLPPIRPGLSGNHVDRSPYVATLLEFVDCFSTSPTRIEIIDGLLKYRRELHSCGITKGFQWLDGSFMEKIESLEARQPVDIDVVSFFYLPDGKSQQDLILLNRNLFDSAKMIIDHYVDAYYFILGQPTGSSHVKKVAYWYSMWAHRRDETWKGFIQVDLAPFEDEAAMEALMKKREGGGL